MNTNTAKPKMMPSMDRILELVSYDKMTGIFVRKKKTNRNQVIGERVGTLTSEGYLVIQIDKERFYAHRLAYYLLTGEQPAVVDHENGNRIDNREINLRGASRCQNVYNAEKTKRNKSGHKNVHWNNRSNKWDVQINADKRSFWGGSFSSLDEAVRECKSLRMKLHGEFANHGEER
ncbi:HNH endonuclease [Kluyvera ascorbata]|uniref:HNH endonuclease n=1 Tax=Kluyvera ascorbata TaxID=51288 RepID=UPI00290B61B3|nr:HNH endonuclease [Kluyvera ascorbata]MDU3912040.1 HNH endonuclease [Kluyvera ascorbata]